MSKLQVSRELSLPPEAVTQTFAIFGKRGSGKTNTAVVIAEEMFRIGAPFVILDPIGAWWGLKSSFDGKGPGLAVYIFGGDHADLPLEPAAGQLIADVFIQHRIPMVLDMSGWSGADRARFVTDFALRLLAKNGRQPMHVFIEEADAFVPQRPYKGEERMLGAMDRLVRWGRQSGIGATLITQRSAKVNKDVTTQAETLVAHRTVGPQDRDAIDAWIKFHAGGEERQQVLSSLPTLPDGTAWVWSPEWLSILRQVAFRRRQTYDSASTPKMGEQRPQPKQLAEVDVERLRGQLASTIEKAKAEDPRELRKRIQELERQLKQRITAPVSKEIREVEKIVERLVPVPIEVGLLDQLHKHIHLIRTLTTELDAGINAVAKQSRKAPAKLQGQVAKPVDRIPSRSTPASVARPVPPAEAHSNGKSTYEGRLGKGERKVLSVLAQWPDGRVQRDLAFLTGYSARASTLGVILSKLRQAELVEPGQPIKATQAGLEAAGGVQELPTGPELLEHWLNHPRIGEGERKVLRALIDAYPEALTHAELCERTGYSPDASTIGVILSKLRKLGLVEGGARRVPDSFMEAIA